jgi:hypothetical protein
LNGATVVQNAEEAMQRRIDKMREKGRQIYNKYFSYLRFAFVMVSYRKFSLPLWTRNILSMDNYEVIASE